jgi:hypothetical protein
MDRTLNIVDNIGIGFFSAKHTTTTKLRRKSKD